MRLAQFITSASTQIISEWEQYARTCLPAAAAMDLHQRRDHLEAMLKTIARDLETPQTRVEQAEKSKGLDDSDVGTDTAANAHGTDRAATGYTPMQMVGEFRALRASILRLWSEAQGDFTRANLDEVTRFNEAVDQLLAESIAQYAQDVGRSKDLFIGVLGHDLRNPLGAIMMSTALMMTDEGPDWPHQKAAARIVNSCTRMEEMIRDLLDFTRTRLGSGIPVVREPMDMGMVCRQAVDEIAAFHPDGIVRLETSGDLRGEWDHGRIAQVLSNLVGNAYQHGAEDVPVGIQLRGEPDHVVLTVHNEGTPIATHHLGDIFDPFRQIAPADGKARDLNSVGLGLYIAQSIVHAHGGTIDVESTDQGTTFTARFPRSYGG
jgi:hypothetical protein